jgi:hypothetical protein
LKPSCRGYVAIIRQGTARPPQTVVIILLREQVPVDLEGHLNRAVPHQRLDALGPEALVDQPSRKEVAEPMQPMTEAPVHDIGVRLDLAGAVREHQPELELSQQITSAPITSREDAATKLRLARRLHQEIGEDEDLSHYDGIRVCCVRQVSEWLEREPPAA